MRRRATEILHPRIRDFYAPQAEIVDRVLQKPGLLASRFHEGRSKVGPHDLYRDARKPTSTSYVSHSPGTKQRFVQKATQRIEDVVHQYGVHLPGADDVRTVVVGEKPGILLQVPAPLVAQDAAPRQPPVPLSAQEHP